MKHFPIPLRPAPFVGAASQPADEVALDVMPMPHEMNTFQMPRVPERVDPAALAAARDVLARFAAELARWDAASGAHGPVFDLAGIEPAVLAIVNDVTGEGEVSIRVDAAPALRIQETVFAGVWRCCELDAQGRVVRDWIEAGAVPRGVEEAAAAAAALGQPAVEFPAGAMNSPALLAEIGGQLALPPGAAAPKQINLTLLPLTPEDHAVLERALPVGPVAMISRGFGSCHVTSTLARGVWRVQYFNSMKTLILDTIEVTPMPEVAVAAPEDLADSLARLDELVQWMGESARDAAA
jgi:hydrogenase-1 operon protein HyaF